jgi:hypothetical protein
VTSSHLDGVVSLLPLSIESPIPAVLELLSTAPPTFKQVFIDFTFVVIDFTPHRSYRHLVPLHPSRSLTLISMYISPSFEETEEFTLDVFPLFADYKGLTPYVQSGVVREM